MNATLSMSSLSLIVFSACCGVAGQLSLKVGMSQVGQIGAQALEAPLQLLMRVAGSPLVLVGLGFYFLGTVTWLTVLSRAPLSFAYPILALSYAVTPIMAWLLFSESMPSLRWAGIITIILGIVLVARS